jgi:hypothetical protein
MPKKALVFASFLLFNAAGTKARATDWAQPPLLCVEEVVPQIPKRDCLDLSKVADPTKELPADLPADDLAYWKSQKFGLPYCRALEILRREETNPGSMRPAAVEIAWMRKTAVQNHDVKVKAVYDASETYQVPPLVLTGALFQESIFSELGIAEDGGNYSCGVAQINATEWCRWANGQTDAKKIEMGWPSAEVNCTTEASPKLIKPFYDIAVTRLAGLPIYRLQKEHFQNISFDDVKAGFPSAPEQTLRLQYQVARSFLDTCGAPVDAIMAKANELAHLYSEFVPAGMKQNEIYSSGDKFQRACMRESTVNTYPLHTGWLLAVGTYNAGPRAVDIMSAFNGWSRAAVSDAKTFQGFDVKSMIASIYKAGVYNPALNVLEMNDLDGAPIQVKWMKMCVLQRHIARVVQHVTQPLVSPLADTLEGPGGCNSFPGSR